LPQNRLNSGKEVKVGSKGHDVIAAVIFLATYAVIAFGRAPGARLDRAGAALLGASLMVASGALSLNEAFSSIDPATITLLLGMMIVVANLRFSGFFGLCAMHVGRHARHPVLLLAGVATVSGLLSAFLVNDAVCLMLTPLVAETALKLKRNPVPYVLAVAASSNIGSAATITGNPQNMIIGSLSHIPYGDFVAALSPVAAAGLLLALAFIVGLFPAEFLTRERLSVVHIDVRVHRVLLARALLATAALILFFFLGQPPAKVAIAVGALLLWTRRVKPERVYAEIDWALLLMFAGLFIVVAGAEKTLLTEAARARIAGLGLAHPPVLAGVAFVLSNLVSNVPAVLVLKPFVASLPEPSRSWELLAMASTFAGNFTLVGSVANLIVVERARRHGVMVDFRTHLKLGAPLALVTTALGVALLW
jgi:Na+/H+ antiporter NhaD/arsenite permease-like protein